MRKFIIIFFLSISFTSVGQQASTIVNRKVLFSTLKGEKPVFNESSISLSPIGTNVTVITSDEEGRIFIYENGKKKGPFKDIPGTGVKKAEENQEEFDPIFRRESDSDYEAYTSYDKDGQVTIKFRGKSFGPFQFILELYFSNDKTVFSALIMKDGKPQVITSAGNSFLLNGQPGYTSISPAGKKMMVTSISESTHSPGMSDKNLTDKTKQITPKPAITTAGEQSGRPPEAYIYFQDGKKFGPYDPKKINSNNPAFIKTGGDNWLLTIDSKLYINGKPVKNLDNERISPANIWLTEDGKRYAIIIYNKIEFSDGSVYKDPLKIRIATDKGKITVWWLSFENGKDIVLYSKVL
jgi:hypothetical protein